MAKKQKADVHVVLKQELDYCITSCLLYFVCTRQHGPEYPQLASVREAAGVAWRAVVEQ